MKKIFTIILFSFALCVNAKTPIFDVSTNTYHSEVGIYTVNDNKKPINWVLKANKLIQSSTNGIIKMKVKEIKKIDFGYNVTVRYKGVISTFKVVIKGKNVDIEQTKNGYFFKYTS